MGEQVVVTDGTDSFYGSRAVFQSLFDHADFDEIKALSSSVAEAKKMLISRQARYSGLIDVLKFSEGSLSEGMAGATMWVAMNAKPDVLSEQIAAAKQAGIKRAFVHLCSPEYASLDTKALEATLQGSGMSFTLLRTGKLSEKGAGGALKLEEVDIPTCEEVAKEDVFRFITEALTLPEAYGRTFSLCPSLDASQLKEMRFAGCTRREEVEALLKGQLKEKLKEEEEVPKMTQEEEAISKAEDSAKREEELKMLLQRAKEKGIENQKRMKKEEEAKKELREQRATYFKSPPSDDDKDDGDAKKPPGPPPDSPKKPDDKDDDGLALA